MAYAKGKKVIPRIFRQIDQGQRVKILVMIMFHIGVLDVVRRAQLRPEERQLPTAVREEVELFSQAVMPSLFAYVNEAPLTTIIGLLGILLDSSDVHAVAKSKVGLSILTMFLSRAELVTPGGAGDAEAWGQGYVHSPPPQPTIVFFSLSCHAHFSFLTYGKYDIGRHYMVVSLMLSSSSWEPSSQAPLTPAKIFMSGNSWLPWD